MDAHTVLLPQETFCPQPFTFTLESIDAFLASLRLRGRSPKTLETYEQELRKLYQYLPEDKQISVETMSRWRESLLQKYSAPGSVNLSLNAFNSYARFVGRREFYFPLLPQAAVHDPELTREEYLRLLQAAIGANDERSYIVIKLLCLTGIRMDDIPKVTVEAVEAGEIPLGKIRGGRVIRLPESLRRELRQYAHKRGCLTGPLITGRGGAALTRTPVNVLLHKLGKAAGLPKEKATPRCLRKLYQRTQDEMNALISAQVERAYENLLEQELMAVGKRIEHGI